ncbi:hypothetical protein C8F04DRAFT_1291822 [Mycena alexandri]|uniref:Uncharacterized protein n=1 Tax=Mycena alexandri TaxID=1745969 RepID=A0AAD6SJJ5_9AGAR|nr:hypothetical protein C8F04DRAFT_1291822 [Mycena alexandri]
MPEMSMEPARVRRWRPRVPSQRKKNSKEEARCPRASARRRRARSQRRQDEKLGNTPSYTHPPASASPPASTCGAPSSPSPPPPPLPPLFLPVCVASLLIAVLPAPALPIIARGVDAPHLALPPRIGVGHTRVVTEVPRGDEPRGGRERERDAALFLLPASLPLSTSFQGMGWCAWDCTGRRHGGGCRGGGRSGEEQRLERKGRARGYRFIVVIIIVIGRLRLRPRHAAGEISTVIRNQNPRPGRQDDNGWLSGGKNSERKGGRWSTAQQAGVWARVSKSGSGCGYPLCNSHPPRFKSKEVVTELLVYEAAEEPGRNQRERIDRAEEVNEKLMQPMAWDTNMVGQGHCHAGDM